MSKAKHPKRKTTNAFIQKILMNFKINLHSNSLHSIKNKFLFQTFLKLNFQMIRSDRNKSK
jgi:hypothetical protein